MSARVCAWCRRPIPSPSRADRVTCSKACRQARARFTSTVGVAPAGDCDRSLRIAYADPPYPGKSRRYYGDHPDFAGEVDHVALVKRLREFDAWALSTSAAALPYVLSLCPAGSRVAAWHRGPRAQSKRVIVNAWEPVIYFGARREVSSGSARHVRESSVSPGAGDVSRDAAATPRADSLVLGVTARRTDPARVIGAKPAGFARWIFDLLGALPGDTLTDIYPGSGAIARAWEIYSTGVAA